MRAKKYAVYHAVLTKVHTVYTGPGGPTGKLHFIWGNPKVEVEIRGRRLIVNILFRPDRHD